MGTAAKMALLWAVLLLLQPTAYLVLAQAGNTEVGGAPALVSAITLVNAKATPTTSIVQVTLGAAPPYQVARVCASTTSPALVNNQNQDGVAGVCLLGADSSSCVAAGACVDVPRCITGDYPTGYCLRPITLRINSCATCKVDAQIIIQGIQLDCAEPYQANCTAGYNTSTALVIQAGNVTAGATQQVASRTAWVGWMQASRTYQRVEGTGQTAFMWGDAVYFTMGLKGVAVQAATVKALLTKTRGNDFSSVNNTGYLDPQYLGPNGMGWDVATQTMLFAYPVDEGLAVGLSRAEWGSATQQEVLVRAVLRVSFDTYNARRRRRSLGLKETAGEVAFVVTRPAQHRETLSRTVYAALVVLAGVLTFSTAHRFQQRLGSYRPASARALKD